MNHLNVLVSEYPRLDRNTKRADVNLQDWLLHPTPQTVDAVMAVRRENDPKRQEALKKQTVPSVTISGTFDNPRNHTTLIKHSGLICLDFDIKPTINKDVSLPELRQWLTTIPCVAYVSTSIRQNGLFAIIPISEPENHLRHFRHLQMDFAKNKITVDRSCSDVNRLRCGTVDPDPYVNVNCEVYRRLAPEAPKIVHRTVTEYLDTSDVFQFALSVASSEGTFIKGERHNFIIRFVGTLITYGVPKDQTKAWIDRHLIPLSEIEEKDCIDDPYQRWQADFGKQTFRPKKAPEPIKAPRPAASTYRVAKPTPHAAIEAVVPQYTPTEAMYLNMVTRNPALAELVEALQLVDNTTGRPFPKTR